MFHSTTKGVPRKQKTANYHRNKSNERQSLGCRSKKSTSYQQLFHIPDPLLHSLPWTPPALHNPSMSGGEGDEHWMQLALGEAQRGVGHTSPNPPVGAVIVSSGKLLGKGWHRSAGQAHAEREAITDALSRHPAHSLVGATVYVTLEPCSSHGRTPPCTEGIINAGISRVVYGVEDPNPEHIGRARHVLQEAGIETITGVCATECAALIRPFAKVQRTGLPWVLLKSAISLDGRITRPAGESQWLSSEASREFVQKLRFQSDAIITGGNTLRIDNPALTIRDPALPSKEQPWRMVITRGGRDQLPSNLQVFTDQHSGRTLVQENGDLRGALETLAARGCNSVLVEAGGILTGAFLDAGLVDEVAIFYAPMLTGGPDSGFAGLTRRQLCEQQFSRIGDDILLRALIQPEP